MAAYEIVLNDESVERIADASGYQLEGPMTTFFRSSSGRSVLDSWSERLASYRSTDVKRVRRIESDVVLAAVS